MKNYLMFALLIGAATTMAFGQAGVADPAKISVACPDADCHVTQVFKGEGGFVGMKAKGADKVTFVVTCGSVSTSGDATLDGDLATQALTDDNGLSCHAKDGGSVEVQGLMDGGWYWITDDMNTAVANLLPKDAMGNAATKAANPGGDDFEVTEGATASYIKQKSTGRVGIVSHILPVKPDDPAPRCGARVTGSAVSQVDSNCMMGDGGTVVGMRAQTTGGQTGGVIDDVGASVDRNASELAGGDYNITLSLWGNGTGHISAANADGPTSAEMLLGHPISPTATGFAATWTVRVTNATPGTGQDLVDAGIALDSNTLTIQHAATASETYCQSSSKKVAMLEITGTPTARSDGVNETLPKPKAGKRMLSVGCPGAAAANMGQELVPDNPFPTDR